MGGSSNEKMEDPAWGKSNMSQGPLDPPTAALVRLAAAVAEGDVSELQERLAPAPGAGGAALWVQGLAPPSMGAGRHPPALGGVRVGRGAARTPGRGRHAPEPP